MPSPSDRFNVTAYNDDLVCAKYLTYYGAIVYALYHNNFDPNSDESCNLYIVADDFCFEDFLIKYYNWAVPLLEHKKSTRVGSEDRYMAAAYSILAYPFL